MAGIITFAIGLMCLGALFLCAAWLLLAEYRKHFFADPRVAMSFEVFAQLLRLSGHGYLAALALFIGTWMFWVGAFVLCSVLLFAATESFESLTRAISLALGNSP